MLSPHHNAGSIQEFMEPAIEGPPSPESIRAISNQMRLASNSVSTVASDKFVDRGLARQSHQTSSSGSSSLRSMTSTAERPSWDRDLSSSGITMESNTSTSSLSRKSSGRSTVSSTQPRDSVQIFGKSIFGKRMRARRESSAAQSQSQSHSSSSSVYSAEGLISPTSVPPPAPAPVDASSYLAPGAHFVTSSSYTRSPPPTSSSSNKPFSGLSGITSSKDAFMPFFSRRRSNARSNETINEDAAEHHTQQAAPSKKFMISGPFNFQHLTSPDDSINTRASYIVPGADSPVSPKTSMVDANSYFPDFASGPSGSSETLAIGEDAVLATVPRRSTMRPHAASVSSATGFAFPTFPTHHRSLLNHSQSTDQLRTTPPPPRPPRSPIEASHSHFAPSQFSPSQFSPPIPPPRMSSCTSLQPGDFATVSRTIDGNGNGNSNIVNRPRTSGSFRQPSPFSFSTPNVPRASGIFSHSYSLSHSSTHSAAHSSTHSLAHSHSLSVDLSNNGPADTRRYSQMPDVSVLNALASMPMPSPPASAPPQVLSHDDSNWPLSSPGASAAPSLSSATNATFDILPGVPEEEEHSPIKENNNHNSKHRSRMSVASNASSLRKSHSLPLLQQFPSPPTSFEAVTVRPPSAASDTLGTDIYAAQRTMRDLVMGTGQESESDADAYLETSWEDDIDYCYEHEIEADCEYAWDRPSLDMSRDEVLAGMQMSSSQLSPGSSFDVPALSPGSRASTASISEAITPTTGVAGFATTRRNRGLTIKTSISSAEERPVNKFLHARSSSRGSRASLFVEAQGFDLSPSLFIPGSDKYDCFRPPARGPVGFALGGDDTETETEVDTETDEIDENYDDLIPSYLDPATIMGMDKSMLYIPTRTSASTTGSGQSRDSVLSSQISATSTATDLTRLTMSTMSTSSMEDMAYNKNANRESMIDMAYSKNANRESMILPQF